MPQRAITTWRHNLAHRAKAAYSKRNRAKVYEALDVSRKEIRLLILEPGRGTEPLRASFKIVSLAHGPKPVYETCSYVWGSPLLEGKVYLDGSKAFYGSMLSASIKPIMERSQQVSIMADIYGSTTLNLIWLGEEEPYSLSAVSAIHALDKEIREDTEDLALLRNTIYDEDGWQRSSKSPLKPGCDLSALSSLLCLEWFSRLWVVQEVALSPRSICYLGELELGIDIILRAGAWLQFKWQYLPDVIREAASRTGKLFAWTDRQHGIFASDLAQPGLLHLLVSLRGFQALDGRDHVFAVLGLLQKRNGCAPIPDVLTPDYTASLADVLHRATKYMIQERTDLAVLDYVSHRVDEVNGYGMASWTPRWERAWDVKVDPLQFLGRWQMTDAGHPFTPPKIDKELGVLVAEGVVLGLVRDVGTGWHPATEHFYSVGEWMVDAQALVASVGIEHQAQENILAMVLCAGTTETHGHYREAAAGAACSALKALREQWRALEDDARGSWLGWVRTMDEAATSFEVALVNASINRVLLNTSTGHVGRGPQTTRSGDIVAILYGSRSPVIIRESEQYPGDYDFVGTCYVHGIMDGEAVHKHKEEGRDDQIFRVR